MEYPLSPRSGRQKGEGHHNARLTEKQVREIKRRLRRGEKVRDLAKEFGVTPSNVSLINQGRIWLHVEVEDGIDT